MDLLEAKVKMSLITIVLTLLKTTASLTMPVIQSPPIFLKMEKVKILSMRLMFSSIIGMLERIRCIFIVMLGFVLRIISSVILLGSRVFVSRVGKGDGEEEI